MDDLTGCEIEMLGGDSEFEVSRIRSGNGLPTRILVLPIREQSVPASVAKLENSFALRDKLDAAWAARPVEWVKFRGRLALVMEDPGGEFLDKKIDGPLAVSDFLRLAIGIASSLAALHGKGLVHKDVKPANIIANVRSGEIWLTGFSLTTRLPRHRQPPDPPEIIAGTLAYMAPEQTGRMNRSIDSRSDLYSLGVTFYEMLVGALPFTASDPMEWINCHVARLPVAPSLRRSEIPEPLSAIILKLLEKAPEERYQTAAGVVTDLRRCLSSCESGQRIESFSIGDSDVPDRLMVSETLYGRENEIELLLAAFNRVVSQGSTEFVLVSGYSGVGKSSVVNELHKVLVAPRGLFASGKFDQYKRDIPYSTLVQASQSLVRPLLGKSDAEFAVWRGALLEALEPNARLMTDLIPELKLIIGDQPPVPELEPQQVQGRFHLVFRRFIGVFARPEHPLAIFFDDLQWIDTATLDLLEYLLTRSDLKHVLLVGAYRDNEVDACHPLMHRLQTMRNGGASLNVVTLGPLAPEHMNQLIADALCCESERAAPLAALVYEKTGGNPFFVIQFLHALSEEGLIHFDHAVGCWSWDLNRIHDQGYTDNVVELMVGKLSRLPAETRQALQQLACLGNEAGITTLSTALGIPEQQIHVVLWEALRQELVERVGGSYKFSHDRIHEAAYSLISESMRAQFHLRIGRLLATETPAGELEEKVFEIVAQLNRGAALITDPEERGQLAGLNLIAGKRAQQSTAYASALTYLIAGVTLLPEDSWERRHELRFALELNRAECEFLTGQSPVAEQRLAILSDRATTTVEQAAVTCMHVDVSTTLNESGRAVAVCLNYLRNVGIEWPLHPTDAEAQCEYQRILSLTENRTIEELIDLRPMKDPESLATVEVLSKLLPPAYFMDANLASLTICKGISLSLEYGNCDASCVAYAWLARIAGWRFGQFKDGFRFGQLAYELVERRGLVRFRARTYLCFATFVVRWTKHVRDCRELVRRAFEAANRIGDLTYAAFTCDIHNSNLLFAGDRLLEVQDEAELGLAYAQRARFGLVIDLITTQLALIRTLRGLTPKFGSFDDGHFNELRTEQHLSATPALAIAEFWYWARKLQVRCIANDYAAAMDAASKAQPLLWTSPTYYEVAEYHFYGALACAAFSDCAPVDTRQQHLKNLIAHHRQLQVWEENCEENFENRTALVGAEIARLEGRELDAERLYEQAIRSARDNAFVHNEAIAYEVAARFYAARGFQSIANAYLRNARYCYLRWGADGKVRQLDRLHPHLAVPDGQQPVSLNATFGAPVGQLDAETVIRASQALSSEIVLPKLIEKLMQIAVEHAAAGRGLLILLRGSDALIEAEATIGLGRVVVNVRQTAITPSDLPQSALHYVIRTRERVVLDDASIRNSYSDDPYWEQRKAKSVLCLPIVKQTKLIGVLYLENNLAPHVFTAGRMAVLDLLASQAAISLENARLYAELRRSEALLAEGQSITRTGTWNRNLLTNELFWSDESYRVFGYRPGEVEPNYPFFLERVHAEDRESLKKIVDQAMAKQSDFTVEFRIILPNGTIRHVQSGARHIGKGPDEDAYYIGTNMDITERKSAERELRRGAEKLRETQAELAHVSRVTTMGELAASIAHEVNQPITGVVINGNTCLRLLARCKEETVELKAVREAIGRVIRDGNRAGEIVSRIRALFKKTEFAKVPLDLNQAVREIIVVAKSGIEKQRVSLRLQLHSDLPHVLGDRVQIQQVLLNLILNATDAMSTVQGRTRELIIETQRCEDREVVVTVRDSGIGIHPESIKDVFAAFHTTKPGGLGMGLSISRSIVEDHSGRLWVTGHEGPGASFLFTLPLDSSRNGPPAQPMQKALLPKPLVPQANQRDYQ
jgi:PAS domain S-box-containing protein